MKRPDPVYEEFNGKQILMAFYRRHLHRTGLSKVVFTFEAARHARRRRSVVAYFDEFFSRVAPLPKPEAGDHQAVNAT